MNVRRRRASYKEVEAAEVERKGAAVSTGEFVCGDKRLSLEPCLYISMGVHGKSISDTHVSTSSSSANFRHRLCPLKFFYEIMNPRSSEQPSKAARSKALGSIRYLFLPQASLSDSNRQNSERMKFEDQDK